MKTGSKAMAVLAVVSSTVLIAGAQDRPQPVDPVRKPTTFKCPVCRSPCVSKDELIKQRRMLRARRNQAQAIQPRRTAQAHNPHAAPGPDEPLTAPDQMQRNRQQRGLRFDLDGNGQLSRAERAARRAYVRTLRRELGDLPGPRKPVEE